MSDSPKNTANRYQRLEFLLEEALDLAPEDRTAFYLEVAEQEGDLVDELKTLVEASEEADGYFDQMGGVVSQMADSITKESNPLEKIGPYPVVRCLGEGSMGAVYLVNEGGRYGRLKAAKLLKSTWQSEEIKARFQAEDYTLAMMDHNNIVRVDHTGVTDNGLPYFIMEYVEGIPITDYCVGRNLTLEARLDLFRQICDGVLHAHQKGVIHRDLKPSNLLITEQDGTPVAKIIDFGIAKIFADNFAGNAFETQLGTIAGTPAYMSPEQAGSGLPVDTRSDIYALGLILYEMLTCQRPMGFSRFTSASLLEQLEIIQKVEPPKPSKRVLRQPQKGAMSSRQLRGDLDLIILKALEKDPARRYSSVGGLRRDIDLFLAGQPVEAGPPGNIYRIGKLIRRYKAASAAVVIVMISLLGALSVSVEGRRRAESAEAAARAELDKSQAILGILTEILNTPNPQRMGGKVTVTEALLQGEERLVQQLQGQDTLEREVRDVLGQAFFSQGLYVHAERQYRRVVFLDQVLGGRSEERQIESRIRQFQCLQRLGRNEEAEAGLRRMISVAQQLGRDHRLVQRAKAELGLVLHRLGDYNHAEQLYREILDDLNRKGAGRLEKADALHGMARSKMGQAQFQEAEQLYLEVLAIQKEELGEFHPSRLLTLNNYGMLLSDSMRYQEAVDVLNVVIEHRISNMGPKDVYVLRTREKIVWPLMSLGRLDEAEAILLNLIDGFREAFGPDSHHLLLTRRFLADVHLRQGHLEKAVDEFRDLLKDYERLGMASLPDAVLTKNNLGDLLIKLKRLDEAVPLLKEVIELQTQLYGSEHNQTLRARCTLAEAYQAAGDPEVAEVIYREVEAAAVKANLPLASIYRGLLGSSLVDQGRFEEAGPLLVDSLARLKKMKSPYVGMVTGFVKRYEKLTGEKLNTDAP